MKTESTNLQLIQKRIKRLGDTLEVDPGMSLEERLSNIRLYYTAEQYQNLILDYQKYDQTDAFEYSYLDDIFSSIVNYTNVISSIPMYLVCSNPLYNVRYHGNGQIIEIDKGYMWFVHHIADIFALYLPKVASENISEKDFREIVSMICDVVIQVRNMKIHELLQTPVTSIEYKLASFFEYAFMTFTCLHELGHKLNGHEPGDEVISYINEVEADRFAFSYTFHILRQKFGDNRIVIMAVITYFPVFQLVYRDISYQTHPSFKVRQTCLVNEFLGNSNYCLEGKNTIVDSLYQSETEGQSMNLINNFMSEVVVACMCVLDDIEK